MGAMIIGIFTGFLMYLYLFLMFILVILMFFVPAAVIRFFLLKRPAEKKEWYRILRIECIICGIFAVISILLSLRYAAGGGEITKTVLSALISFIFEFSTIFCVQWLILRIPKNKLFSKERFRKKASDYIRDKKNESADKTGMYYTTDYTYHDADDNKS